jgi:hypothetical protein
MEKADIERLARVEVGVNNLIKTVDAHVAADCNKLGCLLHDDVESLKNTQKTARRITWSATLVGLGLILREIWKGVISV